MQLKTQSKMFCACPVGFGDEPNKNTCPTCLGLPGALPVLNRGAIEKTVLAGIMLGCETPPISKWDRKNYFYPDMPKNYQISQFDLPLCLGGCVPLYDHCYPKDAQKDIEELGKEIGLTRIHLEEDVAKSTHSSNGTSIDFNRAGTPLMEIVSEPEITSPEEAFAYLNSLRQILIYGDLSDADMEKGQMRCDVNVSVRKMGERKFGTRCEIKNVNSIRFMQMAIEYEAKRQVELLESNKEIDQETRLYDSKKNATRSMRSKEDAHDYRYFPDPDLLPLNLKQSLVDKLKKELPELPDEKKERFIKEHNLSAYEANILVSEKEISDYYEEVIKGCDKKLATNWITGDLFAVLNKKNLSISQSPVSPKNLSSLIKMITTGKISGKIAKDVFEKMQDNDKDPHLIVEKEGLIQQSDPKELERIISEMLSKNQDKVTQYKSGKEKLFGYFVGEVMKISKGKANPQLVNEILKTKLK